MADVLAHFVQMDHYTVPDEVARKGYRAIEQYIGDHQLEPDTGDTRDWEIVDVDLDSGEGVLESGELV